MYLNRKTGMGNNLFFLKSVLAISIRKKKKVHLGCSLPQLLLECIFTFFATAGNHRIPEFQKLVGC
jgi:hypothetical protein